MHIMSDKMVNAVMLGLGYIGLPTAALMAKNGIRVHGVDVNSKVVDTVNRGEIHIVEPELDGLVRYVIDKRLLKASTQVSESDVFLIAVPTPFKDNHVPDISFVEQATKMIIPHLKAGNLFIIESTSPIYTTEKMADLIHSERPELKGKIYIAYCPERVLPGNVIYELENNDRVIGGLNLESTKAAIAFYRKFVKSELHETNSRTAEMCKLVENSSRDVNIAFANELSLICNKAGINVWELISLANKHPRVNILQPGTGVGGHCIAVDPWFIASEFPEEAKIIRTAREINNYKTLWVIEKIKTEIFKFQKKHNRQPIVALMGLAFKPNIDDLRESPAKFVADQMIHFNEAEYLLVEPNISKYNGNNLPNFNTAFKKADIVVYLVAHKEFVELEPKEVELDFCGIRK